MSQATAAVEVSVEQLQEGMRLYPVEWVSTCVRIEDPDTGLPQAFNLWPAQRNTLGKFLEQRLTVVLKARQLGLTWLVLAYAVWRMLTRPGYRVSALSKGEDEAKELVRRVRFILEHMPRWCAVYKGPVDYIPGWDGSTEQITVSRAEGEPSTFQAFAAGPNAGRAFTAALVIIDEWAFQDHAEQIWSAAYPTINRPSGGQVVGISTARRGTLFQELWDDAGQGRNGFRQIFLPWTADPRRNGVWLESTKTNLRNTWRSEYPSTPEEAFSVGQGAFFEEWDEAVHVTGDWRSPRDWAVIGAYDPGFASAACFKWYSISPDGWAVCFREYYPQRVTDKDQAAEVKRLSIWPDGSLMHFEYIVADTDAWVAARDSGKSTAEVFGEAGLPMIQATKDLENGWRMLHQWLKPFEGPDGLPMAMLRFTSTCQNTRRTYPACISSQVNPEDIARSSEHHPQDVDRYFCMSRPQPLQGAPPPDIEPTIEQKLWARMEEKQRLREQGFDENLGSDW